MQLFICYTPLQILVAKALIDSEKIKNYYFVYLYDNESKKNEYYYELLKSTASFSKKIFRTKNIFTDFINIYKLSKVLKNNCRTKEIDIYSGNIKSVHTRFLMFLLNYTNLYTFDDGCGNISNNGYYADNSENSLYKSFFQLFAPSLVYKKLRNNMKVHYTIFREKNIYPNNKYLPLYHRSMKKKEHNNPTKTILLTSVLAEDNIIDNQTELKLYETIISNFHVTDIIPHPREKEMKVMNKHNVTIMNSHLISEDLLLRISNNYELTIIGIFSATLLNLAGLNIVKRLISIDFDNSHINTDLIELFKRRGIECYTYKDNNFIKI